MSLKAARLTLVLPFFNEEDYLSKTVESLISQTDRDFVLLLVDNASTDLSPNIAKELSRKFPETIRIIYEETPGKIHALKAGVAQACTEFVGTLDADTIYPVHYVEKAIRLLDEKQDATCAIAFAIDPSKQKQNELAKLRLFARLLPAKAHSGGCGQTFRRADLEAVGSFDPALWPFVLEDHEIIHRVTRRGVIAYGYDHVCYPAARRVWRGNCSWTLLERIVYKILPQSTMDWFFYRFLTRRFERRRLSNVRLREQSWQKSDRDF